MYKTPLAYRPEIDGLRALAVMAVLLFHLDFSFISGGFVGVDVFFVISGFLITRIVQKQILEDKFSFLEFYARRIRRIFPALFTMLGVSTVMAMLFLVPGEYKSYVKELANAIAQIANIHFAGAVDYFDKEKADSALLHTWSLGVEEQFYLFWPILLILLHKFVNLAKTPYVLYAFMIVSLCVSQYLVIENPNHAFYMIYSRAWELAFGGIIALNLIKSTYNIKILNALSFAGVALVLYSIFTQSEHNFPGVMAILPVLGSGLIIYTSLYGKTYVGKVLSVRPVVWIGLISYSLYLWHWPLIAFYKSYVTTEMTLNIQLVIIAVSIVLAWLSYKFIETPFRKHNGCKKRVVIIGLLMIVILAPLANVLKTGYRYDWRYTPDFNRVALDTFTGIVDYCNNSTSASGNNHCVKKHGVQDSVDVLFMGDSHGIHYEPAITSWAENNNFNVRYIVTSSCPVWFLGDEAQPFRSKSCIKAQLDAKLALRNSDLKYVFMALRSDRFTELDDKNQTLPIWENTEIDSVKTARKLYDTLVMDSLNQVVALTGPSVKKIVLGQVPLVDLATAHCGVKPYLYGRYIAPLPKCDGILSDHLQKRTQYSEASILRAAKAHDIAYFDASKHIVKTLDEQGNAIYRDTNHLNVLGAEIIVPWVGAFLNILF